MKHLTHIKVVSSLAAVAGTLLAVPAFAVDTADAVQIGMGTSVISFFSGTYTVDPPVGPDVEQDFSRTEIGIGSSVVAEIGYGLDSEMVIGGYLVLDSVSIDVEDNDTSQTVIALGPKFDYMFSPQAEVRPFIGAQLGLASNSTNDPDSDLLGLQIGIRGGLRWFPSDTLSIDPMVGLGFTTMSGENNNQFDHSLSGINLVIGVAISAWL